MRKHLRANRSNNDVFNIFLTQSLWSIIMGKKTKVVDFVAQEVLKTLQNLRESTDIAEFNEARSTANAKRNALLKATYYQVKRLREKGAGAIEDFNKSLKDKGGDYTSATSLELKCVRYVFDIAKDDRRGTSYARVLIVADEEKKSEDEFEAWITERGIENIRRGSDDSKATADTYRNAGLKKLRAARPISIENPKFVKDGASNFTLAIVRKNSDGSTSVVGWANKETFVNSVLKSIGKQDIQKKQEAVVKRANKDAQKKAIQSSTPSSVQETQKQVANG